MQFPAEREEPPAQEPMAPVTGTDGKVREGDYLRRSLGLPPASAVDEDYAVKWTPWPP